MTPERCFRLLFALLTLICGWQCAALAGTPAECPDGLGVLLMAHGGSPEWNNGVLAAAEVLQERYELEVAFGMAEASTLQEAVRRLEARACKKIGIVRLFVSGESWYERTEQILGLRPGAPPPADATSRVHPEEGADHSHETDFWRIHTNAAFALSTQGLGEAPAMGAILADRARALSRDPAREDVLILAHGSGDDAENDRLIANIDSCTSALRDTLPFRRVRVMALREDWPEKRQEAQHLIREYVESSERDGGVTLVIPFRLHGFGPYAEVLQGLNYVADGQGLLPHPGVTNWIAEQIEILRDQTFRSAAEPDLQSTTHEY